MATPTKTLQTALAAWQDVASTAQFVGTAFDCSTKWGGAFDIRLGRRTGTAFTAGWPNVRIEASLQTSGGRWTPIYILQPVIGASIVNTTLSAGITANDATFTVVSASNMAIGDILFLSHSAAANYELVRIKSIASLTITPEENVINAHANAAIVTDQAEMIITPAVDLTSYNRVRAVIDNSNSGQAISVEVNFVTFDSF